MSLRLLTDEHIPVAAVTALRARGHDVLSASDSPGTPDRDVLRRATEEGRVLVTCDKGFGRLVFEEREPAPAGIILLRPSDPTPAHLALVLLSVTALPRAFRGHVTVVQDDRVRATPVPSVEPGGSAKS
jgi:predicted nuclease of predicted toxin-antitoxin system